MRLAGAISAAVVALIASGVSVRAQIEQDPLWERIAFTLELNSTFSRYQLTDADFKSGRASVWQLRDGGKLLATLQAIPRGQVQNVLLPAPLGLEPFAVGPNPDCGSGLLTEAWRTSVSVGVQPRTAILRRVGGGLRIYGADSRGRLFDTFVAGNLHLSLEGAREPQADGPQLFCLTNPLLFDRTRVRQFGWFGARVPPLPVSTSSARGIGANGFTRVNVLAVTTPEFVVMAGDDATARQKADFLVEKAGEILRRDASIVMCPVPIAATADTLTPAESAEVQSAQGTTNFGSVTTTIIDRYETNYDIGHVLSAGSSTGTAKINVVGDLTGRGGGISLLSNDNDYAVLAHELSHQLGAGHTYGGRSLGAFFDPTSAVEPGSGSTLMSYLDQWPNAAPDRIQATKDLYLHALSIRQIQEGVHRTIAPATGMSITVSSVHNQASHVVPPRTLIRLQAVVTGITTTPARVRWDGMDVAAQPGDEPPLFRSFEPSNATREFPGLYYRTNVLLGNVGEGWLAAGKTYAFAAVAWGDRGAIASAPVTLVTQGSEFLVTTPADNAWQAHKMVTVNWTPTTLASQVRVLLSVDSGATWTPVGTFSGNAGHGLISAPAAGSPVIVRVEAVDNVFFDESGSFRIRP